jgi:hypothetical protein
MPTVGGVLSESRIPEPPLIRLEHNVGFEPTPAVYKTAVLPIKLIMLETGVSSRI